MLRALILMLLLPLFAAVLLGALATLAAYWTNRGVFRWVARKIYGGGLWGCAILIALLFGPSGTRQEDAKRCR